VRLARPAGNRRSARRPPGSVRFSWSLPTCGHRQWHRHKSSGFHPFIDCPYMGRSPPPHVWCCCLSVDDKPDPTGGRDHVPSTQPTSARAQRARSSGRYPAPLTCRYQSVCMAGPRARVRSVLAVGAMPGMPDGAAAGQPPHEIFAADVDVACRTPLGPLLGHRLIRHESNVRPLLVRC
jgi:hypothetical protein